MCGLWLEVPGSLQIAELAYKNVTQKSVLQAMKLVGHFILPRDG